MVKLYTKNVCPKCMLVKNTMDVAEVEYEVVNMDENDEAKDLIKSKGFMAAPIMEVDGEFIADMSKIQSKINELAQ